MFDNIPLLPPSLLLLYQRRLRFLLDKLGHTSRFRYTFDFGQMHVLLHQRTSILERGLFPRGKLSNLFGRPRLPQSDVGIVASGEDIFVIGRVSHAKDALHSFRVIYVARDAGGMRSGVGGRASLLANGEHADCFIVRSGDEFGSGGTPGDAHDGAYVSLEHSRGSIQFSHVERVGIVILIAHREHVGFHRIPFETIGFHAQNCFLQC
mmetsp:Transcript_23693/g.40461  ORF Transcript_23693/g.40461 Transcript_23693/m.40461 type:complete len:208 (-) Transcript_23693:184-807(-)